ncbi:MAG: 2-C-methyl-D-erythritol 2,4-cyclodiphosphate synthase [Simkaniaceae bacterium]|nr:2-C-methyl-D-erythritol 2,4-cyclodiphosphate synthase [Simkaniaceae bacterium]
MGYRTGIGQDSHRFLRTASDKVCVIGGVTFEEVPGMDADSDGDVVFHAICNAVTSITHVPILGGVAIELCRRGVTDSHEYVRRALRTLDKKGTIRHVALTIEGKRPKLQRRIPLLRQNVAKVTGLMGDDVGISCTSGDELTAFGRGEGLMCYAIVTVRDHHTDRRTPS